jgi:PIN domain nuclease of toxin-antitoxin system
MNCLLDTCAFLWLALEPKRISPRAARAINAAPRRFISFATVWEITLKHSAGKLPLPESPRDWIPSRLDFFQITILSLEGEVVFLSGELPQLHRDPFDRLIAAEGIHRRLPIVTADTPFANLGARCIW